MSYVDRIEAIRQDVQTEWRAACSSQDWERAGMLQGLNAYLADAQRAARTLPPPSPPEPPPVCEGFAWIGQSLQYCDDCGQPAWEHTGVKELKPGARLFTDTMPDGSSVWHVRPWAPGHRRMMAARYGVTYTELPASSRPPAPPPNPLLAVTVDDLNHDDVPPPEHRHDFGPDRDQSCACGYPAPPF